MTPCRFERGMLVELPNGARALVLLELTDAWLCRWVRVDPPCVVGELFDLDIDPDGLALLRVIERAPAS